VNATQLLANFDRLSDAPDAVPRMRRFILDLAVRGKLVGQDSSNQSAETFLGQRALSVRQSEEPWPLPRGWAWSSFEMLGQSIGGGTPSKTNADFWAGTIPWVSPKDMKVDLISDAQDHISEDAIAQSSAKLIPEGTLLMVVRGMILAHSFPTAIAARPVTINQDMKALVPFRDDIGRTLLLIAKGMAPSVLRLVQHSTHGTCKLLTDELFGLPLPIPPLAEQQRIVAKVDELMALCDRLEAAQAERESGRDRLVAASLNRLNQPVTDATALREDACFHFRHLPRLTTRVEHVQQFRRSVLTLAVHGRLVAQDSNDEPSSELLERIRAEKRQLAEGREKRRLKEPIEIDPSEVLGPLPDSWKWVTTEAVCQVIIDCPHSTPVFVPHGVACLDTNGFKNGALIPRKIWYVSEETYKERIRRLAPRSDDVVFAREGIVGESVIVPEGMKCCLGQRVMLFRPMPGVLSRYFSLSLSEPSSLARLLSLHKGIGAKHVNVADMRMALIAIPPTAEQHRIVAKVDELMAVCDRLEAQLTTTQTESRRLLEAVLHDALQDSPGTMLN
jgi:type I restriction enzyme S subunit